MLQITLLLSLPLIFFDQGNLLHETQVQWLNEAKVAEADGKNLKRNYLEASEWLLIFG